MLLKDLCYQTQKDRMVKGLTNLHLLHKNKF